LIAASVYNTTHRRGCINSRRASAVVHCPKCAVEIDLDEDEVEEGEIVTCPECDAELEIVQTHPVHLNLISEDDEEEEDEEEGEDADDDADVDVEDEEEEEDTV
jgi:alpha-aminoadipate/glutamate carrier protein LysW